MFSVSERSATIGLCSRGGGGVSEMTYCRHHSVLTVLVVTDVLIQIRPFLALLILTDVLVVIIDAASDVGALSLTMAVYVD